MKVINEHKLAEDLAAMFFDALAQVKGEKVRWPDLPEGVRVEATKVMLKIIKNAEVGEC